MLPVIAFVVIVFSIIIYYSTDIHFRKYILFFLSLLFISCISPAVTLFTLLFATANYYFGIGLEANIQNTRKKNILFWTFILLDVGVLAFFKYAHHLFSPLEFLFFQRQMFLSVPFQELMIPVGISYYTFQSLGYLIRVSRGAERAERDFIIFANFLIFFPKLIAGPVERSNHFFPQFQKAIHFKQENLKEGARLILWGLFKKVAIADVLYRWILPVYDDVYQYSGYVLLFTFLTHCIYIYCDFSGYTDMARGVSRCFGIQLLPNFNRPFLAKNVSEFWRRWHISLSSWCNDFIYNPFIIKFRKYGNTTVILGLFVTFFVVGIWHGFKATYVILGILQAVAISYEFFTKRFRSRLASKYAKPLVQTLSRIIVYIFMSFSMVFFFSRSPDDAWYLITHLFTTNTTVPANIPAASSVISVYVALMLFLIVFTSEMLDEKGKITSKLFSSQPVWIRLMLCVACSAIIYASYTGFNIFYYARF